MGSLIGFLCVLSALTATGFSLTCNLCLISKYTSCPEKIMECLPDTACGVSHTTTETHGMIYSETLDLSCVHKNQCNTQGSITTNYGKIKRSTSCCHTDNCIAPMPTMPADNLQPNGLICPTCQSDSIWCYTAETMLCTGDENMCYFQTTELYEPERISSAFRGCASESICSLKTQGTMRTMGRVDTDISISCTIPTYSYKTEL
ncbi:phospholipase A2 inhibitor NAI-like isoform X2 [Mixophyes fleayi]|uniref:phospholipase A2 inhibitor NAI-like isoform X2 n=1 Tax=Mixophyes fleayi TaxID=3061075 RepID=UPI003F4D90C9